MLPRFIDSNSSYKSRKTDRDDQSDYNGDNGSVSGRNSTSGKTGGGTRYSRSTMKAVFPTRGSRNSSRKSKEDRLHDDYVDYPADYLTCPVRHYVFFAW